MRAQIHICACFHHIQLSSVAYVLSSLRGIVADPYIHSDSVHIQVTKFFKKEKLYHVKYEDDDEEDLFLQE